MESLEGTELLAVAVAHDRAEGDMIKGLLDEAKGRGPRNYGLAGAYGRIWAWSLGAMLLAFGVFLLLRMV